MTLLMGHNEAETRVKAMLRQTNKGGIEYPSATNDRGQGGRERHAEGDSVGGDYDDEERHASGGMCGSSMPSQGGAHRPSNFRPTSDMPSQGGSHMKPMSGYNKPPKVRARYAEGDMVRREDMGREHHGFGNMVGRAFSGVKKAATPMLNQGMNYAKQQGQNLGNAAKQYGQQQMGNVGNAAKGYASQQLGAASNALARPQSGAMMQSPQSPSPMDEPQAYARGGRTEMREHHSFGSFVKGVKKTANSAGRGITSAAKTTGKGITTAAKATGKGLNTAAKATGSGLKTAAKAAAPYAKQAASQFAKSAIKNAATAAPAAMKNGGSMGRRGGYR